MACNAISHCSFLFFCYPGDTSTRSAAGKQTLDSQLHLFLRNQEDLSAEEEQARASLAQAFPEFNAAWQLKEDSQTWYAIASAQTAVAQLDAWIAHVNQKGPAELRKALSVFRGLSTRNSGLL